MSDDGPWWASGAAADEGLDGADPFDAHQHARHGNGAGDSRAGEGGDTRWVGEALDAVVRLASQASRHVGQDPSSPHEDGTVCDACPVCITLRAVRQVRPEVIGHLSDAAHHLSLALRAVADAQASDDTQDFQHIDLDS